MNRRARSLLLAGLCWLSRGGGAAHPPAAGDQVLIVTSSGVGPYTEVLEGIRQRAGRQPYVLDLRQDDDATILSELPRFKNIRVLVAIGSEAAEALAAHRASTPLIVAAIAPGLLPKDTAQRPLTVVPVQVPPASLLENLKRVFPGKSRLALIRNPSQPDPTPELLKMAEVAGFHSTLVDCDGPAPLLQILPSLKDQVDLVLCFPDAALYNSATVKPLILAALRNRLAVIGFSEAFVRAGAAMGIYPDFREIGFQSAELIQKALRGQAIPRTEAPRKFRIAVNQNITRLLGLPFAQPAGAAEDFLVIR